MSTPSSSAAASSLPSSRTCARTGLRVGAAAGQQGLRIAKPSYGPLNPPLRAADYTGVGGWSRWDVAGHRTIYAAVPEQFAYQEVLQYITPADTLQATRMADVFDDREDSDQSVLEAIAEEFGDMFRWEPTAVAQQWRAERCLYEVTLPTDGWFIEIMHGDSVQALNAALGPLTGMTGMVDPTERITLAHLCGADRALTCRIATALHGLVLDDGSQPHGISFNSKLGIEGQCWAVWLRALDDGKEVSSEPTRASGPHDILDTEHNPALKAAAAAQGLRVW